MNRLDESLWPGSVLALRERISDPGELFLVGGIVRDVLKRRPVHDIDLVTAASGIAWARRIANAFGGAFFPIDPARDTGRAIIWLAGERISVDVARFRGDSLEHDLAARECTANAMAVNLADLTHIIDPLGGYDDLFHHKILRLPRHDAIQSDPIRSLRAVRHTLSFDLRMPAETKEAIRAGAPLLLRPDGRLRQPERCRDEFFKLLSLDLPVDSALAICDRLGLLAPLLPVPPDDLPAAIRRAGWLQRLLRVISPARSDNDAANLALAVVVMLLDRNRAALQSHLWQTYGEGRKRFALGFLALLTRSGEASRWMSHLHLSRSENHILEVVQAGISGEVLRSGDVTDGMIHRYFRQWGDAGIDALMTALATIGDEMAHRDPGAWGDLLDNQASPFFDGYFQRYDEIIAPRPLVDGNAIRKALPGIEGPLIGDLIDALVEAQAEGAVKSRADALTFITKCYDDRQ